MDSFLAGFWLFLYFPHIFCVYCPIFKIFVVINIKIKFLIVLRKHPWRSYCLSAGFWRFFMLCYLWMLSSLFYSRDKEGRNMLTSANRQFQQIKALVNSALILTKVWETPLNFRAAIIKASKYCPVFMENKVDNMYKKQRS